MSGISNIHCLIEVLTAQNFGCFICSTGLRPSTALYRCTIPISDAYWSRVYKKHNILGAYRRMRTYRAFCSECAPLGAVYKKTTIENSVIVERAASSSDKTLADWLVRNSFYYKKQYNLKIEEAYQKFVVDHKVESFSRFKNEMKRLYTSKP